MVPSPQKAGYKLLLVWHFLDVQGKREVIYLFRIMHESNLYHYNDSINNLCFFEYLTCNIMELVVFYIRFKTVTQDYCFYIWIMSFFIYVLS